MVAMNKTISLATALSCLAAPLFAGGPVVIPADPVIVAPAPPPSLDWTGLYAGGQLGWGWASIVESGDPDIDGDGYVGGVHIGYNRDFGTFVAGIELDYNLANIEFDDPTEPTIDRLARLKLRAGFDMGQTLIYAAAGIARAEADDGTSGSGNVYGIGIDHRFSDRWSAGAEYLRHDFDDFFSGGINLEVQTLQARLSYHF
jgi:opacity protein-like surface antigen